MRDLALLGLVVALAACAEDEPASGSLNRGTSSGSSGGSTTSSFSKGVVPIIARSCALTACHGSAESNLNFFVTYEPAQIYAELLKTSPTCASVRFVTPGNPDESMLMLKIENQQSRLPEECSLARRSEMPPGDPPGSGNALLEQADRDTIRRWIAAGAKND